MSALAAARRVTAGGLTVNPPQVSISLSLSALVPQHFCLSSFFPAFLIAPRSPLSRSSARWLQMAGMGAERQDFEGHA